MIEFVNYLKLIATVLITNSHFSEIWPISAMASGGLLGNVIFFAVSGFLLFNIKDNFSVWFSKRFLRVYPTLFMFTLFTVILGVYPVNSFSDAFGLFVYPTNFIFLVWLIVCYVFMYIFARIDKKYDGFLEKAILVLFALWILVYVLIYDKSVYRVDNVYEPFILFLYMQSMMAGMLFRKHSSREHKFNVKKIFATLSLIVFYFGLKLVFSKIQAISVFQILNQFVLLITLYFVFGLFMSLEDFFARLPAKINSCVKYVSGITLQIYVVQHLIIRDFKTLMFPLNLVIVVVLILVVASLLYYIEKILRKYIVLLSDKLRK